MKRLGETLQQKKNSNILDIATGSGQFVENITSIYNNFNSIVAIDQNELAIDKAHQNNHDERIQYIQGDIFDMKELGSFDWITLSNSLHHFNEIHALLTVVHHHLKHDGCMIISEMYSNHLTEKQQTHKLMHHFWAKVDTLCGVVHNETFTREGLLDVVSESQLFVLYDSWVFENDSTYVANKDDVIWLKNTLHYSLEHIKDHDLYGSHENEAKQLEKRIDEIGFEPADVLVMVLKKC